MIHNYGKWKSEGGGSSSKSYAVVVTVIDAGLSA
jgi:hypothetical protein